MTSLALAIPLLLVSVLADFDRELTYVTALRKQGFDRLAELQCRKLTDRHELSAMQRVRLNVELSKTLTVRALNSRQPQRDEFWNQATRVLQNEIASTTTPSSRVLLEVQLGLTMLEQAEWSRREGEIQAANEAGWQQARVRIRAAITQLKQVNESFVTLRRQQAGRDAALSINETAELQRNTSYALSRAYRNQAITYAKNPKDKIGALTLALNFLQPIAKEVRADELVWKSRMDRIECYRLRGDLSKASQLITAANEQEVPPAFAGRLVAEGVRLAIAARKPETALQFVQQQANSNQPELELARVETLVALAEQKPENEAKAYRAETANIASRLEREHGTYWGMRGEILVARLAERAVNSGSQETNLLETTARTLLKQAQPDKAIDTFVRAANQAKRNGQPDQVFDFLNKAAIVHHQEGQLLPAVERFRDAAKSYPNNPGASEAHLQAIFDAAELYQTAARGQQAEADQHLTRYETLLREHLELWAQEKTANQVRIWFGRLSEARGNNEQAMEAYRAIEASSEHRSDAYRRLGKLYQRVSGANGVSEARQWFASRLADERDSNVSQVLRTELAKLAFVPPADYELAKNVLRETSLRTLYVVALAGSGDTATAQNELAKLLPLPHEDLLEVLRGLQPIRDARPEDAKLRAMVLDCVKLLKLYTDRLSDDDRLLIRLAITDAASPAEALVTYRELAASRPRDRRIQLRFAELASLGRDRAAREEALKQWRLLVRQAKPRSKAWFRAKLGVAQTHFDKGEHEKSKQMVELLKTLYPELGGPDLKQRFEALLKRT